MADDQIKTLFGDTILTKVGEENQVSETLQNKHIGVYFSAQWCSPCRIFTPKLTKTYEELKTKGQEFEVVFVSSDGDESSFNEYYGKMPWCALPFADTERGHMLREKFDVRGIPALVIVNDKGEVSSFFHRTFDGDVLLIIQFCFSL